MKKQIVFVALLALTTFGQATPPPKYPIGDWPQIWHQKYPPHRFQFVPGAKTYLEVIATIEAQRVIAERNRQAALYAQPALIAAAQAAQEDQQDLSNLSESSPRAMAR